MKDVLVFGGPGLPQGMHTWYPHKATDEELAAMKKVLAGEMTKADFYKAGHRTDGAIVRANPGDRVPVERIRGGVQGYLDRGQATLEKASPPPASAKGGKQSS